MICNKSFQPNSPSQKFCGDKCRKVDYLARQGSPIEKTCKTCGTKFFTRKVQQLSCSVRCRQKWESNRTEERVCVACGKTFIGHSKKKCCSQDCVKAAGEAWRKSAIRRRQTPRGCYVYGWYESSASLPFYIGQGSGNRAWEKHTLDIYNGWEKCHAACEKLRTSETVVRVYRDNLTQEGALLVESVLKSVFESMGAVLLNTAETMKRQEVPPLEIAPRSLQE